MRENKKGSNYKSNPQLKKRITGESSTSSQRYKNIRFDAQFRILDNQFSKGAYTMLQVSLITGIERANICRYVDKRRKANSIFLVRFGVCPITKHPRVGFYTTDYNLYLTQKRLK
jgi:hypothetical protein